MYVARERSTNLGLSPFGRLKVFFCMKNHLFSEDKNTQSQSSQLDHFYTNKNVA